jgi:hypothetical protein
MTLTGVPVVGAARSGGKGFRTKSARRRAAERERKHLDQLKQRDAEKRGGR